MFHVSPLALRHIQPTRKTCPNISWNLNKLHKTVRLETSNHEFPWTVNIYKLYNYKKVSRHQLNSFSNFTRTSRQHKAKKEARNENNVAISHQNTFQEKSFVWLTDLQRHLAVWQKSLYKQSSVRYSYSVRRNPTQRSNALGKFQSPKNVTIRHDSSWEVFDDAVPRPVLVIWY
jgi:hypothetical protein